MDGPKKNVHGFQPRAFDPERKEHLRDDGAHGREAHPEGLLDGKSEAFDDVSRKHDEGKRRIGPKEPVRAGKGHALHATHESDEKRRQNGNARNVENQLVGKVDVPAQKLRAENVVADVPVEGRQGRPQKEEEKADDERGVHVPEGRFPNAVRKEHGAQRALQRLRILFGLRRRIPERAFARRLHPSDDAPDAECDGGKPDDIDADFSPEGNVPKAGTNRHVGG